MWQVILKECFGTRSTWSEIWARKGICLAGGMEDGLWDKGHAIWAQRWLQVTIPNPDAEPIPSSLACRHCPWMCAEKWWNAVISCTIKTLSWWKSSPGRSAAELERHQPLFNPCLGSLSPTLHCQIWHHQTLVMHLVCSWISQPLCCQGRTSESLLTQFYGMLQSCPTLHSGGGEPIICFPGDYSLLFFVLLTALLHQQLSSGGGPSMEHAAAAHSKVRMESFYHISKTGTLVPLNPDCGFMQWPLWNAAFPRTCTCSAGEGSLVHLLHKGNIIPGRCLPPCHQWGPSVMEKPQHS